MTQRVELSGTQWVSYTQAYDVDNRLIAITSSLGYTSTFYYSADGERVKKLDSNGGWFYIGNILEKDMTRNVRTTYYYLGSQRVAMRVAPSGPYTGTLYWIHADHLGSASLTTNISGTAVSEMRYYPFGEVRWISGTMPTDKTFTGQRVDSYSNIYSMGARWYSPVSGRFLAPDSIVPRPGDPQSLNRFSYAGNSPLNRLDPSGHFDISAFIAGFSDQYVDDLTLGIHSSMNVNVAERMRSDDSAEYNIGRVGGQLGALLFAGTEIGSGGTMAGGSIAAGGGCAVLTIGACAPIGAAVAVGGATVGVGMVGHGLLIAGKVLANGAPRNNLVLASNSTELANNLGPRPTPDSDAHHIISVNDQRAASLRTLLGKAGIDINAAANGVYLPGDTKASVLPGFPNAVIHSKLNTNQYYIELLDRFRNAQPNQVGSILDQIRKDLLSGNFPY